MEFDEERKQEIDNAKDELEKTRSNNPLLKRNKVYYGEKYLEEMLFPNLFPTGEGGYNSSYIRSGMTPKQYI